MSQPSFPDTPSLTRDDVINQIISSIAMEELGLSHIINAEGEKIQYALGTIDGVTGPEQPASIDDLLNLNKSVRDTLDSAMQNQMFLKAKLQSALAASVMQGPTGPTGPSGDIAPGRALFEVVTENGSANVGFERTLEFESDTLDIKATANSAVVSIEKKPSSSDIQFYSLDDNVSVQSDAGGVPTQIVTIGGAGSEEANAGVTITPLNPLISYKALSSGTITELHAFVRTSTIQKDADSTVYAQLYSALDFDSEDFEPVPNTVIELGVLPVDEPEGTILAAGITDLSIDITSGKQLLLVFHNASVGISATTTGYFSGVARIEQP